MDQPARLVMWHMLFKMFLNILYYYQIKFEIIQFFDPLIIQEFDNLKINIINKKNSFFHE